MAKEQKAVNVALSKLLADTYALYLKTQNFHWNITGPHFYTLHKVFEGHYQNLAEAVDSIAEHIRVLGYYANASFKSYLELTSIKESEKAPAAEEMVKELLEDHQAIIKTLSENILLAEKTNDQGSIDLFGSRIDYHEKTAWMLRSFLGK